MVLLWAPVLVFAFSSVQAQTTYTFSNSDAVPHNTWNSNNTWTSALIKSIAVSGIPTTGMVLRQVVLDLGSNSGSNVSSLTGRLTDPAGNTVTLFSPGYFYDTDFSRYVNISFRDHPALTRLSDYTNSYLGMPYSFGYYRTEAADAFQAFNTSSEVNGAWVFEMIENTGTEIQFNAVELVFGPPLSYVDITNSSANEQCDQAQCAQSGAGEVILATNVNYQQGQPGFPALNLNGCNWNAEPNNTAWFSFTASASNVDLSISGFTNLPQQTIVLHNTGTCAAPSYSMVGCPWAMFASGCNSTTGNPTLYHRVCYDGGTKFNHGYSLTGLTVGDEYILIVDGQSGANSTFYIEISSGADEGCAAPLEVPVISNVLVVDPGCSGLGGSIEILATGLDPLRYSVTGGLTFQSDSLFTGLGPGTYAIVVEDAAGETASTTVVLGPAPDAPEIISITTVAPTCGASNGSITIEAIGSPDLQYSIDGGANFQSSGSFTGLPAGSYDVVVSTPECSEEETIELSSPDAPAITNIDAQSPTCFGDLDGAITISASGAGSLLYSIDGGATEQSTGAFTGLSAGSYAVVVTDPLGCTATQVVELTQPEEVLLLSAEVLPESCAGLCDGSVLANATGAGLFSLNAGPAQADPIFEGLCPGSYVLEVSNANGCAASDTLSIIGGAVVQASFTADPAIISEPGSTVTFTNGSLGASTYDWDFGGFGTSQEESPSFVFPVEEGTVEVCLLATSDQGCADSSCVVLRFDEDITEVMVPTVFSPNGDGVNDTFGIIGDPGNVRSFSLLVYNRWGQLLFDGMFKAQVWDGHQGSGEICPDGTYFWVLDYLPESGEQVVRSGHVTLLR